MLLFISSTTQAENLTREVARGEYIIEHSDALSIYILGCHKRGRELSLSYSFKHHNRLDTGTLTVSAEDSFEIPEIHYYRPDEVNYSVIPGQTIEVLSIMRCKGVFFFPK